jgi:hypothetical protein
MGIAGKIVDGIVARVMYGYTGTTYQPPRLNPQTYAQNVIDYAHHEAHNGSSYFVQSNVDLAINHVLQLTFVTPNTTKWAHWTWRLDSESEALWEVYEGATISTPLANAITPYNNDRNSANTSGMTLRFEDHGSTAAANTAVSVAAATLLQMGISGAGRTGGEASRENEIIMKQNTVYSLRVTASTAGNVNFDMDWYEHTNKE